MQSYPWYGIVNSDEDLAQGDFFDSCPIVIPLATVDKETKSLPIRVVKYDVIVMSQSCDLLYRKLDLVLVCPHRPYSKVAEENAFARSSKGRKAFREGGVPGYHLLNKCELDGFEREYMIVDFRNVYGVPFDYLAGLAERTSQRLRLLPPYREHLSQAFARFFMRVGLPVDIPDDF